MNTKLQQVRQAKQELNEKLSYNPIKIIYELLTNIPTNATNVIWEFKKVPTGLFVKFTQNVGTDINTVIDNFLTTEKLDDENHYKNKPKNTGGLFGTGLSLIDYFTSLFTFSTNGVTYDFKTDEQTKSDVTDEVVIEMIISLNSNKRKFIQSAKDLISVTEMFVDNRNHKIIVDGFTSTDNHNLSLPIEFPTLKWKTSTGTLKSTFDFDFIKDGKGNIFQDKTITVSVRDTDYNVKLKNFKIGKLYEKPNGLDVQADRPLLVLVSEETNQILGQVQWKGSYPVSVNNSIIIATVSKEDLRWLFTSGDKYNGFHDNLQTKLIEFQKEVLLKFYPDSNVLEVVGQLFTYAVIVNNKLGKKLSNIFRDDIGLGWMNDLEKSERKDITHMEWSTSGGDRHDFHIWNAKDGRITQNTTKTIIENKRKGFTDSNTCQLNKYVASTPNCTNAVGISIGIGEKAFTEWSKTIASIQGSGQYKNHIDFKLIDLLDSDDSYGFSNYIDEYEQMAVDIIEKNKKK